VKMNLFYRLIVRGGFRFCNQTVNGKCIVKNLLFYGNMRQKMRNLFHAAVRMRVLVRMVMSVVMSMVMSVLVHVVVRMRVRMGMCVVVRMIVRVIMRMRMVVYMRVDILRRYVQALLPLAVDGYICMQAADSAANAWFKIQTDAGQTQCVKTRGKCVGIGQQLGKRGGKHIAGRAHGALQIQRFHPFSSI
jgi:hypothetical protein